jgi:uncharacterized protein (DUF2384 family)
MINHNDAENSEQAVRFARLVAHATATFGNRSKADRWLRSAHPRFAGRTAADLAVTEYGRHLVEEALIQLDEGYFA